MLRYDEACIHRLAQQPRSSSTRSSTSRFKSLCVCMITEWISSPGYMGQRAADSDGTSQVLFRRESRIDAWHITVLI